MQSFLLLTLYVCTAVAVLNEHYTGYNYNSNNDKQTQHSQHSPQSSNSQSYPDGYRYNGPSHKYLPAASSTAATKPEREQTLSGYNYRRPSAPQQSYLPPAAATSATQYWPPTSRPSNNAAASNGGYQYEQPARKYLPPIQSASTARPNQGYQYQQQQQTAREPQQSYLPPSTTARPFTHNQYQQPQQQYLPPSSAQSTSQNQPTRAPQQAYLPPTSFNYQQNYATSTARPFRASTTTARPNQGYNYQQQQQQQAAREPQQSYLPPAATVATTARPFNAQHSNGYQYQQPQRQPAQQYLPPSSSSGATTNQGYNYQQPQQQELPREPQATYLPPAASTSRPFSAQQQFSGYQYARPQSTPSPASSSGALNYEQPEIQHSEQYVPPTRLPTISSNRFQQYQAPQAAQQFSQTSAATFQRFNGPAPTAAAINALNGNAQPNFSHQNTPTRPQRPTGHATIERLPTLSSGKGSSFPTFESDREEYIPPAREQQSFTAQSERPAFSSQSLTSFSQSQSAEQSSGSAADFNRNPNSQDPERYNAAVQDFRRQPAAHSQESEQNTGFNLSSEEQETDKTLTGASLGTNFNAPPPVYQQQNRFGSAASPSKSPSNTFTFESSTSSNDRPQPPRSSPQTPESFAGVDSQHPYSNAFANLWPQQQTTVLHQVQSDSFELQPYYTMESTAPPSASFQSPTLQDSQLPPSQTLFNLEAPRQPHVVYGTPIGTPQSALGQLQSSRPSMQYLPPSRDFQPPYYYY